jgi:hypothetical protein
MTTERIVMNVEDHDHENVVIVNFDVYDIDQDDITKVGGYVQVRQHGDEFTVIIFNVDGDVISETSVPFNFKAVEDL